MAITNFEFAGPTGDTYHSGAIVEEVKMDEGEDTRNQDFDFESLDASQEPEADTDTASAHALESSVTQESMGRDIQIKEGERFLYGLNYIQGHISRRNSGRKPPIKK